MPFDDRSVRDEALGERHHAFCFETDRQRFLTGFASQVGLTLDDLARPGVSLAPREDRVGSRAVACYRVDRRLVLWCDPDVADTLAGVGLVGEGADTAPAEPSLSATLAGAGFEPVAAGVMLLLASEPPTTALPPGCHPRSLRADEPDDMAAIRAFVDRSDPDDVESAALDEIGDGFDEIAIEVAVDDGPEGTHLVAYASAATWDWDPAFADIGTLVDPAYRGRGLARFVVARSIEAQLGAGRIPLYRHEGDNPASAAVARALGFAQVASLSYFRLP